MAEARELQATYHDPDDARRAITALERHGVDAERIRLLDAPEVGVPKTGRAERQLDHEMTKGVARRSFIAAVALALLVAGAGALVALLLDGDGTAVLMTATACLVAGGALGFVYGGFSGIRVTEQWADTFETTGRTTISVIALPDEVIDLRETIATTHPDWIKVTET